MTTWFKALEKACKHTGDRVEDIQTTLTAKELHEEFYEGFGGSNGKPFTGWSDSWVYFPVTYDGSEWVGYAPRNPCDIATPHQGGE